MNEYKELGTVIISDKDEELILVDHLHGSEGFVAMRMIWDQPVAVSPSFKYRNRTWDGQYQLFQNISDAILAFEKRDFEPARRAYREYVHGSLRRAA